MDQKISALQQCEEEIAIIAQAAEKLRAHILPSSSARSVGSGSKCSDDGAAEEDGFPSPPRDLSDLPLVDNYEMLSVDDLKAPAPALAGGKRRSKAAGSSSSQPVPQLAEAT